MSITDFFQQYPVFTQNEYRQFLLTQGTTNPNTQRELLAYHLKKHHITRIRRGFFATIPSAFRKAKENFPVDPFLITGRIVPDTVIAYHSAFDFHGVSYSVHYQYIYMLEKPIHPFEFNESKFICLPFPKGLVEQKAERFGVAFEERQGLSIQVTSLERTVVDVLDRPNYGGGWEEIWRTAEHIPILNLDTVIQYNDLLNNATTSAKLGFFLEQFKQQLGVDESTLRYLQSKKPTGAHYLERSKRESGKWLQRWNLIVPNYILERSWEEPNEDF
ncbi:type IV toxin-antitoxin system AbiEi family antitoxin domain-containing protein [Legionella sp. CNM-1927-20]|uniref:type IV toxin-antitoxin system AbiEi family antitoxin domain-containing protein n=1 Tax=Legionella sp. CNM-1927-20 TaxID=3422221 RepID=UPI00403AFD11